MGAFSASANLENIYANGNSNFKSVDGVLFTSDMSEMLVYPSGKMQENYSIPKGTSTISSNGVYLGNIKNLFIPLSVLSLSALAFKESNLPTDIYYEGTEEQWDHISKYDSWYDGMGDYAPFTSIKHYNATGIPVTTFPIISYINRGKVNNAYQLAVNVDSVSENCKLIVAIYKNGKVIDIQYKDLYANLGNSNLITVSGNADYAKLFVWDSLSDMRPLCEAKTIPIE